MQNFLRDIYLASRGLARNKGFTATAIFTLALSLAATTVVLSVINAVLIRNLPYPDSNRLMVLHWRNSHGQNRMDVTAETFLLVQQDATSFDGTAAIYPLDVGVNLSSGGVPRYCKALRVSARFLQVLNVSPFIGRDFRAEEDLPGGDRAAILSYRLWQQEFAGSSLVRGKSVRIDHEVFVVVGVMPQTFQSYPEADIWLPMQMNPASADPGSDYRIVARLKAGVSREQAQTELGILSRRHNLPYIATHPEIQGELVLQPLQEFLVGRVRGSLVVLFAAVLFVLMIACTNLAILLLVRALGRKNEIATRAALGSSRLRMMHIPLIESLLLAVMGGLLGLILGKESLPFVLSFLPSELPLRGKVQIDGTVLWSVITVSLMTVLIFGLVPAWKIARTDFSELLRRTARGVTRDFSQARLASILVTTQMALTLVLLAGSATLLKSFLELRVVYPGFDSRNVVVAQVSLAGSKYVSGRSTGQLMDSLLSRLQALREVESAATVNGLPLEKGLNLPVYPTDAPGKIEHAAEFTAIGSGYFAVLRTPRVSGRYFDTSDTPDATPVAIVNETLARRWWPHEDAVGHFLEAGEELGPQFMDKPRQVVGVVSDIHEAGLDRTPMPAVYVPAGQVPNNISGFINRSFLTSIVIRTRNQNDISRAVSSAILSTDPDLALASLKPFKVVWSASLAGPRFYMSLTMAFGLAALLLSAIGFWGLLRYQVQIRTKEIGIRVALGARPSTILLLFAKQGFKLVGTGLAVGTIGAYPLVRFLEQMFYTPHPGALVMVIKTVFPMGFIALASSVLTSVQAATIDPSTVLRID